MKCGVMEDARDGRRALYVTHAQPEIDEEIREEDFRDIRGLSRRS